MRKITLVILLLAIFLNLLQSKNKIFNWGEHIVSSPFFSLQQNGVLLTSVGTLITSQSIDITNNISGVIKDIKVTAGQFVRKGEVLIVLKLQHKKTVTENKILSPSDGKISLCQVNFDEYVSAGSSLIKLQPLHPLYVQFTLPEQTLPFLHLQQPVDVILKHDNQEVITPATIHAIYAKTNEKNHRVLIQARLADNTLSLYPGMFALIKIWVNKPEST